MNDSTTFVCEECGAELVRAWSDEESSQEYEDTFGRPPNPVDDAVVCDDCYESIMLAIRLRAALRGLVRRDW